MKFQGLRFSGLVIILTTGLPGLWWRLAHGWFDGIKTFVALLLTVFGIFLVCWEDRKTYPY